jgi:hypothetical protein
MNYEPVCTVDWAGAKKWRVGDLLHREDGPAYGGPGGCRIWYSHGKKHRVDGPALEGEDGSKVFYVWGDQLDPEKDIYNPRLQENFPDLITSMITYLVHES